MSDEFINDTTYDITELLNYSKLLKVINLLKNEYNFNCIKFNIYQTENDSIIDTARLDITYIDITDIYSWLKEIYCYNDIAMYVKLTDC